MLAVAWHMPVSKEPFLYAIAVNKQSYSKRLIEESGVFAVNFVPFSWKDKVLFCGRHSGMHRDKFAESGLEKEECTSLHCVRVKDALGYLECQLVQTIDAGDHVIFLGKVLHEEQLHQEKRLYHVYEDEFTTTV